MKRHRHIILFLPLLVLTALALLPWQPQGPFDARDYTPLAGMHLDYPLSGALLEPLLALGHVILGAPDFRLALGAVAVWLLLGVGGWMLWQGRTRPWWHNGFTAVAAAVLVVWCLLAYVLLLAHVHFPGWRLLVDDPELVVADLQSHTIASHDGLARAPVNLAWHQARGYGLTAITEHDDPRGSFHAREVARAAFPALGVVPGIEVGSEYGGFLLGLGLKEAVPLPDFAADRTDYARRFTAAVHQEHGGAVIAMAWPLDAAAIPALAAAGVDGFEIANTGHPDVPLDVRQAMLDLAAAGQVVLVASTDWHGWSGFTRTWTVMRVPGAAQMTPEARAAAAVELLRARRGDAIVPVVAGYLGPPSFLRVVLTPLTETVRYAAELSGPRLAAWWVWGLILAYGVLRRGVAAGRWLAAGLALTGAAVLAWRGYGLWSTQAMAGEVLLSDVLPELGVMAWYGALGLGLAALWLGWRALGAGRQGA